MIKMEKKEKIIWPKTVYDYKFLDYELSFTEIDESDATTLTEEEREAIKKFCEQIDKEVEELEKHGPIQ